MSLLDAKYLMIELIQKKEVGDGALQSILEDPEENLGEMQPACNP